ncbi:MAG: DUF3109 family protein [Bacteroidales bacterium]|nr:DUF3109 family protein [Bacteroidales bacterium]
MLIVSNCIVSEDIADCHFACPLSQCKGACCIEGDAGAPLEEEEVSILERILPEVKPYMTPEGILTVEEQGVAVREEGFGITTPLIDDRECAYVAWGNDGTAFCAIEQAFRDGKIDFMKPISCHLYPIRLDDFGEFIAVNYHQWDICRCAACHPDGQPLYQYLREPLIRRFGQAWYDELLEQIALRQQQSKQ